MDKVRLTGMQFFAHHGCSKKEREEGQDFEVDVEIIDSLRKSGLSDNLKDSYDFNTIFSITKGIVLGERCNLIETLAGRICGAIKQEYDINEITVRIRKPDAPVGGEINYAEVEITR